MKEKLHLETIKLLQITHVLSAIKTHFYEKPNNRKTNPEPLKLPNYQTSIKKLD